MKKIISKIEINADIFTFVIHIQNLFTPKIAIPRFGMEATAKTEGRTGPMNVPLLGWIQMAMRPATRNGLLGF